MKALLIVALLFLTGCGTTASYKNFTDTGFIMVSQGKAGGIWKVLQGKANYCKITTHGKGPKQYRILFQEGVCVVELKR